MSALLPTTRLLDGYPRSLALGDASTITVRPMRSIDQQALLAFFRGVPEADRWFLREDVCDPAVIRRWVMDLDYDRVLALLAFTEETVVADATLHRRGFGARRHIGEVRVVVAPSYRGRGLAYALLVELSEIASNAGLSFLEAEIVAGAQSGALEAVEQIGFCRTAVIPDYFRDRDGAPHDMVHLVLKLSEV